MLRATTHHMLVAAFTFAPLLYAACSTNSSNPTPTPIYTIHADGGDATARKDGSSTAHADAGIDGTTPPSRHDGGFDAPPPDVLHLDGSTDVIPADASHPDSSIPCETDAGCWSCLPTTGPQFLNQCTASQCSPFDNFQRLPNYDGSLPPLN
jgi:hypothetical protein